MNVVALLALIATAQGGAPASEGRLVTKDTKAGTGVAAKAGDRVTVHYTGKLTNGKQFDSSVGREPFTFILGAGEVIQGWDQGVQGMKATGKRQLTIPASLGYGARGAGEDIPPNSTLMFDVELLKIDSVTVKILKPGSGTPTKGGDKIQVHYTGKFRDGKKFDSSLDRNQPFEVTIGRTGLIPGFTMGLIGMRPGEKREVSIPAHLGYGERGAGNVIPPNTPLVFEIELLKVQK
jgi:peptidylprolyl isomerase